MAVITTYMQYTIFFRDQAEANFAIAVAGGTLYKASPRDAAATFGIPFPYPSPITATTPRGIIFYAPYTPGAIINFPNASGVAVDDSLASISVPGQASNIGVTGPDGLFVWCGSIVVYNGNVVATNANIPQRRFAIGFEGQGSQEPNASTLGNKNISRDAARIANGFGLAIRKPAGAVNWQATLNSVVTPVNPWANWERFYFRLRNANPSNDTYVWFIAGGSTPTQMQVRLRANATGSLSLISYNGATNSVIGTSAQLVLEKWYKIDILTNWNFLAISGSARLRMYINGTLIADGFVTDGIGSNNPVTGQTYSRIGVGTEPNIGAFNGIDCDFDDWMNAEMPAIAGTESLTSLDWFTGIHIREHYVTADGPSRANWGALPAMVGNQQRNDNTTFVTAANAFTTTTNNALLDLITDVNELQELYGISFGVSSVLITTNTIDADVAVTGQLGYSINGVPTLSPINDTVVTQHWAQYSPTGRLVPVSIIPFNVQRQKGNSVNQVQALGLYPYVEYVGIFEACDDISGQMVSIPKLTHNSPYFNTSFGQFIAPLASSVFMYGGTYVGNGTQQDIVLPCPVHFVWIRATGGVGVIPVDWFSWMWGGHRHGQVGSNDFEPIRICYDPLAGSFKMTITASGTSFINNNATTYQIIAFSDVGMRYMMNDAIAHQASAVQVTKPMLDTLFTPDAGFFGYELATTTNANHIWYRGSGNSGNDANSLTSAGTLANIGSFLTGQVTLDTALNALATCKGYSAWRLNDGSSQWAWQRTNYIGDGSGVRVINLPLASGRFPLFALVTPHNGVSWFRDPTHAGGNSSQYGSSTDTANGIVAGGVDSISVGTSLNVNLTQYDVFVIMGNPSGWLNGLYWPYNYLGGGTEFIPPPTPPPGVNIFAQGGLILGATTPLTLLKDISGIYTLVSGKRDDSLIDRQTGQTNVDVEIPDPTFKTGYLGD